MAVATLWGHRALLASALGCTVREGGVVCDNGRPLALSSTFVPPRREGWQSGPPRSSALTPHGGEVEDDEDDEDDKGAGAPRSSR